MGPPSYQQGVVVAPKKSNLEVSMENFVVVQTYKNEEFMNQNLHTNKVLMQLSTRVESISTHTKMLETWISQVAQKQAS